MNEIANILKEGGIGVMSTDTIYGVVGSALNPDTIARMYRVRERSEGKPFITLIASLEQLDMFSAEVTEPMRKKLNEIWPAPVSVILPVYDDRFSYLHRGTHSLAFRMPDDEDLRALLLKTGPLAAPSANPEGEPPAATTEEARAYFGDSVDFYRDGGRVEGVSSTLVAMGEDEALTLLREGSTPFQNL